MNSQNINSEAIKTALKNSSIITFTKKNGDERVMKCTTNFNLIPEQFHPKPKEEGVEDEFTVNKEVKIDPDLHKVFDLEANGWRSFRTEQVTKIEITN